MEKTIIIKTKIGYTIIILLTGVCLLTLGLMLVLKGSNYLELYSWIATVLILAVGFMSLFIALYLMAHMFVMAKITYDGIIFNTLIARLKGKRKVPWDTVEVIEKVYTFNHQISGITFILYDGTKLAINLLEYGEQADELYTMLLEFKSKAKMINRNGACPI